MLKYFCLYYVLKFKNQIQSPYQISRQMNPSSQNYFLQEDVSLSHFLNLKDQPQIQKLALGLSSNFNHLDISKSFQGQDNGMFLNDQQMEDQSKGQIIKNNPKNYSRRYRQKQKQQMNKLKQQNTRLKKTIDELQLKLKESQYFINSIKYNQNLNGKVLGNLFQKQKQNHLNNIIKSTQQQTQDPSLNGEHFWQKVGQYSKFYGFAGIQKINQLNYYMSQVINNLISDNQKRFMIQCLANYDISIKQNNMKNKRIPQYMKFLNNKQCQFLHSNQQDLKIYKDKFFTTQVLQKVRKFQSYAYEFYANYVKLITQTVEIESQLNKQKQQFISRVCPKRYLNLMKWYQVNTLSKEIQAMRRQWLEICTTKVT